MLLLLRRRLIIWALMFLGIPLLARGLELAAEAIESRRGPVPSARRLRQAGRVASGLQASLTPGRRHWWTA